MTWATRSRFGSQTSPWKPIPRGEAASNRRRSGLFRGRPKRPHSARGRLTVEATDPAVLCRGHHGRLPSAQHPSCLHPTSLCRERPSPPSTPDRNGSVSHFNAFRAMPSEGRCSDGASLEHRDQWRCHGVWNAARRNAPNWTDTELRVRTARATRPFHAHDCRGSAIRANATQHCVLVAAGGAFVSGRSVRDRNATV